MKQALVSPAVTAPPKVHKKLDLSNRPVNATSAAELKKAITDMPKDITHLILSKNQLSNYSGKQLVEIFRTIPAHVTHLDLQENTLGIIAPSELELALRAIPKTVVELLLGNNSLSEMGEELVDIFRNVLNQNLLLLDLSFNEFDTLPYDLVSSLFAAIPRGVRTLDIQGNLLNFGTIPSTPEQLTLFEALPPNLTTLNMANNNFGEFSDVRFCLRCIPRTLTCLDLSGTTLARFTDEQLTLGFGDLPPRLAVINLGFHELPPLITAVGSGSTGSRTNEKWAVMLHRMPASVKRVTYNHARSLADCLPNTANIRQYATNVLVYMTPLIPELIKLVMNYNLDQPTIWPSFYTVSSVPTLEVLDAQGKPITQLQPMPQAVAKPDKNKPIVLATLTTYPSTFFSPISDGTVMALDPSLNGLEVR